MKEGEVKEVVEVVVEEEKEVDEEVEVVEEEKEVVVDLYGH